MTTDLELSVFTNNSEEELSGRWGMVIDQDICTGCQACVAACAMENNVPFVGEVDTAYGRGMHWIRVERLWEGLDGDYREVKMTDYQPTMCQQCHNAPCEPVCPVYASVHSMSEDLNLQVYNRCVGTRYCANNCPYQVRTFNWRDYTDYREGNDSNTVNTANNDPSWSVLQNQLNPDVTVRRRGVMEKCTFCIQRIHKAEDKAKAEGREIEDGEFTTACAQACPANAITFGRIDDPETMVTKAAETSRGRHLLEEMGTLPRVTYLQGGA
jgi:molybdopterin-containing oxidoreductase family iron-sulfur binding subunit